jgi:hypothetical protein
MAKYNRDEPLPSSDPLFKKEKPVRRAGNMPVSEAKARIAQYEKQTGKKYKGARNTGALRN